MRLLFAAAAVITLLACAGPLATYQVPVTVQNHTNAPIQLVISNDAMDPGEQIGSATPQIVPAFDFAHVTLAVPGSRSWALFVLGADPRPRRVLRDEQLGGCRTFKIPIEVEVSVQGGSMHFPADNC